MGPILIFDKSFLQSISVDESCWLENFFIANITPLFYVETLADIEKQEEKGKRKPLEIVRDLSRKSPNMSSAPNVHHLRLIVGNLRGMTVDMSRRPILSRGTHRVSPDGSIQVYFEEFPETAALKRWENGEFIEIEKNVAKEWRKALSGLNFDSMIERVNAIIPLSLKFKNLVEIKNFVNTFVKSGDMEVLLLAFDLLGIPYKEQMRLIPAWNRNKPYSFEAIFPYVSFVLKIDLVFYLAMARGFISKDRPSHKIDLSYLYYLPFCTVFVSNDRLHSQLAPLFMEKDQLFVQGKDLKIGLAELNNYYKKFEKEIRKVGIMKFTSHPPADIKTSVSDIWDFCFPKWRTAKRRTEDGISKKSEKELIDKLNKIEKESVPIMVGPNFSSDDAAGIIFKKKMLVQKGSWRILPEGIENKKI
jgi:hypothetical protein